MVAPDFVIIEVLFYFGWRKETFNRCQKRILANIDAFKQKEAAKRQKA